MKRPSLSVVCTQEASGTLWQPPWRSASSAAIHELTSSFTLAFPEIFIATNPNS